MIYVVVLSVLAALVHASQVVRQSTVLVVLVASALATFVALRGPDVSSDFLEYREWYLLRGDAEGVLERPPVLESLFFATMSAAQHLGLPFRLFLWVIAVAAISIKFHAIRRFASSSSGLWAGVCCYLFSGFLLHEFTQLRAGLAIAFFLLSLVFLTEQRPLLYAGAILAGALFHSSALLGLVAWPLSRPRRGLLDLGLLATLALSVWGHAAAIFSLATIAEALSVLDARVALYVQLASVGENDAAEPLSIRAVLMLLLVTVSYGAMWVARKPSPEATAPAYVNGARRREAKLLLLLRLIVLGHIALFVFAEVREVAIRVMEFWIACLPLYAAALTRARGMRIASLIIWVWLFATFGNYVFRTPTLVAPYSISL
jgi:hypothetical protein